MAGQYLSDILFLSEVKWAEWPKGQNKYSSFIGFVKISAMQVLHLNTAHKLP